MEGNQLVTIGLPVSLFIIMVGMGLSLTLWDFRRVAQQPRAVAVGTLLQLLCVPALGFAIGWGAGGGVFAAGLVLTACLPGGTTSNVLSYLAKANLALSITLTVIASLVTILSIPFFMSLALRVFVGEGTAVDFPMVRTLLTMLVIVVAPVALGMAFKHWQAALAQRLEPIISAFSLFVLIAIVVGIVVVERERLPSWIAASWLPVLLLNLGAVAIGFIGARLSGLTAADCLTVAIETSIKNTTLALTIALSVLGSTELALPAAVYGLMMYATVTGLCWYGRRQHTARMAAGEPG